MRDALAGVIATDTKDADVDTVTVALADLVVSATLTDVTVIDEFECGFFFGAV
jgi:hypothetical protein